MSFLQRTLTVIFTLGDTADGNPNNFKGTNSNTVTLSGLRISAKVIKAGFPQYGNAQIVIYGMTKSLMDQLSTLGIVVSLAPRNAVTLYASDTSSNPPGTIVFTGGIYAAWGDFSAEPEVPFYVEANTAWQVANIPYPPSSFKGSSDVVTILGNLAFAAGFNLENSGVSGIKLSNSYLYGSPLDQINKIKQAISGQVELTIDGITLAIWPKNGSRAGAVPLVDAAHGMVAYPNYNANGITLKTLFNPSIQFGKNIQVQSTLGDGKPNTAANGLWRVYAINHDLESQVPRGQWFSEVQAQRIDQPFPVP